jgi:hypothetical protein
MSDAMKRLAVMAAQLRTIKERVADLEEKLKAARVVEGKLELEDMPELMKELELKNFELQDGTHISVDEDLKCNITEANRSAAHAWLRSNKHGGVIRTTVAVNYAAGETKLAIENSKAIAKITGRETAVVETVHAGTLKSLLKELRRKGKKIPADLFGLFPFSRAKVTPPKNKE